MNAKIEHGNLVVDVGGLLEALTSEDKRRLIDSLACEEEVIAAVVAQILDGWTEMSSHGWCKKGEATPSTALETAVREVARRSTDVAKREIDDLVDELKWQTAVADAYRSWGFKLYNNWPMDRPACTEPPQVRMEERFKYEVVRKRDSES